jgi:hypothetical protein
LKKYLIYLLCWIGLACTAQNPVHRVVNNLNGLPSNTVYDIEQDATGFIWIAHNKGLSRYDGKAVQNFRNVTAQGKALSNILVRDKHVWVQDFSSNFYYLQGDSLLNERRIRPAESYIPAMFSPDKQLISLSADSIRFFDINQKKQSAIFMDTKTNARLVATPNGYQVFGNNKLFDLKGQILKKEGQDLTGKIFFVNYLNGHYYGIDKANFPYVYPLFENLPPKKILKKGLFIQAVQANDSEIWVCTSSGAYCFDSNFEPKYNGFCFFEGTSISKVLKDREE